MLGYKPDDVLLSGYENEMFKPFKDGLAFWEQLLHPDDAQRTGEVITAHINGETDLYKVEYRMKKADGSWMWSLAVGKIAEYDDKGNAIRFNGVNIDIQESKDAQEKIEEQKLFVDTLINSQEQIVITTDGETLLSCNDAFLELFHLRTMEEFTKDYECICDRFETDETSTYLQKHMGEISWIEYVLTHKSDTHKVVIKQDGIERIFTVSAAVLPIGEGNLRSAVFTDVTEAERAKKDIESILDNILLPVLITSKTNRKILYANKYAEIQYETTLEEMVGSSIDDIYTIENQNKHILQMLELNGEIERLEEVFKTKKGNHFSALLSVAPIRYQNHDAYIGMVADISQQKAIEQEVRALHRHTQSSIEYASLIQQALIPPRDLFEKHFKECFTIWNPKDIVGGDLYLLSELRNDDECLLMVIDCTGHGVPGAFVTMLVKAIERQVIATINSSSEEVSPGKILSIFNKSMKHLLRQEDEESVSNAGFDGAILYFNKKEKVVKFSGAETALFYIDENELKTIKGNRQSIGYKKSDANFDFIEHTIEAKDGMQFYITTDGYLDQNGGEKGFPFGRKNFTKIIEENHLLSLADQQEVFLYEMMRYRNNEEKNDDVTVIGIKI
jgi:PAS domain S-box-containing protein